MGTTASTPRRGRSYPTTTPSPLVNPSPILGDAVTPLSPPPVRKEGVETVAGGAVETVAETTGEVTRQTVPPELPIQEGVVAPTAESPSASPPAAPRIAVALHVGNLAVLPELLTYTKRLQSPHAIFANIVEGLVDVPEARRILTYYYPAAVITVSENRGMDIGGFLRVLPFIAQGGFDYILKLHTKSNHSWRRTLIEPLLHDESILALFQQDPTVGLVGARRCLHEERAHRRPNAYYCQQLAERYQLPYRNFRFIGGTMFWLRASIVHSLWPVETVEETTAAALATLNTPETLDPHWFMINYRTAHTVAEAVQQYQRQRGKFRNCLEARLHGVAAVADGMIEHAYERLFGMLTEARGYRLVGV